MTTDRLESLFGTVQTAESVLILPHNDPDPDAIASAVALRELLAQAAGVEGEIVYKGIIGRAENRALVRYLGRPLRPLQEEDLEQATHIALIDTQPGAGNNAWQPNCPVIIVIDHHPWREATSQVAYSDVRSVGSASTILIEYFQEANIKLTNPLLTALFYGIKTDTRGLSRGTSPADIAAYFHLQAEIDVEALAEIERAQVPMAYFKSFATALEATEVYEEVALSYIGQMDYPDLAAEMADLLSRLEAVGWVICLGTYHDTLFLAVRTPGRKNGAGQFVQAIVGEEGTAGGHGAMAGGQIPLNGRSSAQIVHQLRQRILDYLQLEPETQFFSLV